MQFSRTDPSVGPEAVVLDGETTLAFPADGPRRSGSPESTLYFGTQRNVHNSFSRARYLAHALGVAVVMTWALPSATFGTPSARAAPCPDVEVVFARGTTEPPGVGWAGQEFVDALRTHTAGPSVGVYAVDYPATADYANSSAAGAHDAATHVQDTIANCPDTKIVLGGYSQGAVVISRITTQLPPHVADRVAAVAVFSNPSSAIARRLGPGGPLPTIGPLYTSKTIDLCVPEDIICSDGRSLRAHDPSAYVNAGLPNQAAEFVARRLKG